MSNQEHQLQLTSSQAAALRTWLSRPNGAWPASTPYARLTVEAVEGGGLLVRTYQVSSDQRPDPVSALLTGKLSPGEQVISPEKARGICRCALEAGRMVHRADCPVAPGGQFRFSRW